MINIVAGYFENRNILEASKEASSIEDLNVSIANSEQELINAFKDPGVDAVVRGSLKSHEIMKFLKEYKKDSAINRATFINTFDDEDFLEDYEFLLAPVGIDEGKTIDERLEIAIQAALFLKSINKQPKIAILAAGRKDDFGRTLGIDKNLKESEDLCEKITQKLNDLDAFDNDSDDESMHFEVKNYYILIEKAIKEGNNIILAPDGVTGNIIFRTLVLLNSWPSNGAVTLGIDEGKTIDERLEIAIQAALFLKSINKQPKIAILAAGREDDFGRTLGIDKNLKESEDLCEKITQKLNDLDAFDNDSDDESMHFEVKNYYILIEKAIKEGNNIILAPDGVTGNIIFRTLVLLNSWPSNGAVTLGIDEIFVDTSRDQSVEGYLRSIKLAYDLAKAKKESL